MSGLRFLTNQTPEGAPALDRPGTEIVITDRTHALFGQHLRLVFRKCPGRRDHVLVERWHLPTWNLAAPNPPQWPDGTYSVAAAAELLNVYPGTIWLWLRRGVLTGHQLAKGIPWHIELPEEEISRLRARLARTQRTRPSRRPAP